MDEKLSRYKLQISIFLKQQPAWWMQYLNRCIDDQITVNAGYLAYVTLLSIVPLVAVGVAIFSAFPGFESTLVTIENFLFTTLVPPSTDVIKDHISAFAGNATKMTHVGVGFLAV